MRGARMDRRGRKGKRGAKGTWEGERRGKGWEV